jgi:hypothetical protein
MVLFEEDGKRLLFTGDGAWEDIIDGLEAHGWSSLSARGWAFSMARVMI